MVNLNLPTDDQLMIVAGLNNENVDVVDLSNEVPLPCFSPANIATSGHTGAFLSEWGPQLSRDAREMIIT